MTVADRIAVMNHGKIVQIATPAEIYEQPISRYVADFVGDINLLEGRIAATDGGGRGSNVSAPAPWSRSIRTSTPRRISTPGSPSVRRRFRSRSTAPQTSAVNCVEGEVWDIGYLGDVSVYHVRLATGATVKSTVTNRTRLVERPISWDDKVWLSWTRDSGVVLTS